LRVFLTGATGAIGRKIVALLLERGDETVVLTRDASRASLPEKAIVIEGDPCYAGPWQESIAGCDAVINLVGEPLAAQRWNAQFRQRIHDSRIDSTRFVAEAIVACHEDRRPGVFLNASGIDYYGFAEVPLFDDDNVGEDDPGGESYLSYLCWDWEDETKICSKIGVRVALLRTGVVFSDKGALPALVAPFLKGFGGPLGTGRQWMSWIHIADAAAAYVYGIDNPMSGAVNLVAPGNVRNDKFATTLGNVLGRKSWFRAPAFAVMAAAGGLGEYILKGRRTHPTALLKQGFEFRYPDLEPALRDLL